MDLNIHREVTTTVRELEPGDFFIRAGRVRKYGGFKAVQHLRVRTEDPFNSHTIHGSNVRTFPSDKVHPVEIIPTTLKEAEIYGVKISKGAGG